MKKLNQGMRGKNKMREGVGMRYVILKKPFYVNYRYQDMEQKVLYIPPNHLFLEHPGKNGNFCYMNNGRALEDIQERIEKGDVEEKRELSPRVKKQMERALAAVTNSQQAKEVFNKEAKSLFDLVKEEK